MGQISLTDILDLLGEEALEDRHPARKARFRRLLAQPKWMPADLKPWIDECLEKGSQARPIYFHAFQDIVVSVGLHLGMKAEYGLYGRSQEIGYDGKWNAASDRVILLEVKTSPWPVPSVHQLGSYMSRYATHFGLDPDTVYGLFVVGPGDFTPLLDQIKGGEYRSRMKMIEVSDLLSLWQLKLDLEARAWVGPVSPTVQNLLFPFESVNVGSILALIQEVAVRSQSPADADPPQDAPEAQEWSRSELLELLGATTPAQRTLICALCAAGGDALATDAVVSLMSTAARECPGLMPPDNITSRTFAGAIASLHRLCQHRSREIFFERTPDGYRLGDTYLDWVVEWASGQQLVITPEAPEFTLGSEASGER